MDALDRFYEIIDEIKGECPHCEGEGGHKESQSHPYGDTVAWESYWVDCEYCAQKADEILAGELTHDVK